MSILNEIKQIIKEQQKDVLLSKPSLLKEDGTSSMRPPSSPTRPPKTKVITPSAKDKMQRSPTVANPNFSDTEDTVVSGPDRLNDIRPGFNLYHGVMTEVFTQIQSMSDLGEGNAGEIVKKVTQWALLQIGQDEDTQRVFQSSNNNSQMTPQMMSAIVQKAMLIILNHVAKQAQARAADLDAFDVADAE